MEVSIEKVAQAHVHFISSELSNRIIRADEHLASLADADDSKKTTTLEEDDDGGISLNGTLKRNHHSSTLTLNKSPHSVARSRTIAAEAYFRERMNLGMYYAPTRLRDGYTDVIILTYRSVIDGVNSLEELAPHRTNRIAVYYIPETLRIFDDVNAPFREYEQGPLTAAIVKELFLLCGTDLSGLNNKVYFYTPSSSFKRRHYCLSSVSLPKRDTVRVTYSSIIKMIISSIQTLITHEWRRQLLGWEDLPGFSRDRNFLKILVTLTPQEKDKAAAEAGISSNLVRANEALYVYGGNFDQTMNFTHIIQWTMWENLMPEIFSVEELTMIRTAFRKSYRYSHFEYRSQKERDSLNISLLLMGA